MRLSRLQTQLRPFADKIRCFGVVVSGRCNWEWVLEVEMLYICEGAEGGGAGRAKDGSVGPSHGHHGGSIQTDKEFLCALYVFCEF